MSLEKINIKPFIKQELKSMIREILLVAQGFIGKEMNNSSVNSQWRMGGKGKAISQNKNNTNTLRNLSGRLFKSFALGNEETATEVERTNENGFKITIGSDVPYARIHDLGGTINNGFGKGIAINIPKRPYFTPGIKKFETEKYNKIIKNHIDNIVNYWNSMN